MDGFEKDIDYMRRALELAGQAAGDGEVPVGCLVVHGPSGRIVGEGRNRREGAAEYRPSALGHAELEAIGAACAELGGWRLHECDLYVTLEPCPMCAGAAINARIRRVVYGAADPKSGACVSKLALFECGLNHKPEVCGGVLAEECGKVLSDFFKTLRST